MMEFWLKITMIANGYLIEYPTGEWVDVETPFFTIREDKTQKWYCATKKQLEEVVPRITLEGFERMEKARAAAAAKKEGGAP